MLLGRCLTLALILVVGSGCRTWRSVPPQPSLSRPLAAHSRVTLIDGKRIDIVSGRVTPDSVTGDSRTGRVTVPRDSVARLEERRLSWSRSVGLFGAIYFGLAFIISGPEALGLP